MPSITVIIPTRGRPDRLFYCVGSCITNSLDDIEVIVCLDDDDPLRHEAIKRLEHLQDDRVRVVVGPRPKTIGHLVNEAVKNSTGDWLFFLADDYIIDQPNWCDMLLKASERLPNGIGVLYPADATLPDFPGQPIISRKTFETVGYFMTDIFPFWFADTWWDEIGKMLGEMRPAKFTVSQPEGRGETHGIRDLRFWLDVFRATRPMRVDDAKRLAVLAGKRFIFENVPDRTAWLRSDATIAMWEARSGDAPSARYAEVKGDAEILLKSLDNTVTVRHVSKYTSPDNVQLQEVRQPSAPRLATAPAHPSLDMQNLPEHSHEGVAKVPPDDAGAAPQGQLPQLRERLQEPWEANSEALREMRGQGSPDAPPGLQQAAGGDMALQGLSPEDAR